MAAAKRREGVERLKAKGEAASLRAMVCMGAGGGVEWRGVGLVVDKSEASLLRGVEGLFSFCFSHLPKRRESIPHVTTRSACSIHD
jgi:hypothetical protein